jgi:hypothetical protein
MEGLPRPDMSPDGQKQEKECAMPLRRTLPPASPVQCA